MSQGFIKPTKAKIILTIIIAILHIVSAFYSGMAFLCTQFCPEPNLLQKILFPTMFIFSPVMSVTEFFEGLTFLPETFASILISISLTAILLAFWYFLACLAIKAYYFFNKKNKHKPGK